MASTKQSLSKRQEKTPTPATAELPKNGVISSEGSMDVLTLAEAADYLRVSEEDVLRMVQSQGLVARQIGEQWRFLKAALQEWLRSPSPPSNNQALRSVIGSWKDDPDLDAMLHEI